MVEPEIVPWLLVEVENNELDVQGELEVQGQRGQWLAVAVWERVKVVVSAEVIVEAVVEVVFRVLVVDGFVIRGRHGFARKSHGSWGKKEAECEM